MNILESEKLLASSIVKAILDLNSEGNRAGAERLTAEILAKLSGAVAQGILARSLTAQVAEFHRTFGQPILTRPQMPAFSRRMLRRKLVTEECKEFDEAMSLANMIDTVDAIADAMYVLEGSALEIGVNMVPVLAEVHRANMAKVWPDGTVHKDENGKIMKPPDWTPPDIARVLREQGWEE